VLKVSQFNKIAPCLLTMFLFVASNIQAKENTHNHQQHNMSMVSSPLTEAGNDVFGTIQEVISKLNADPTTDWSNVNIEALRSHLVDMYEMMINVISQEPIKNGLSVKLEAIGSRAFQALKRVLSAHPMMLEQESGWKMDVVMANGLYYITATTTNPSEVDKIRGLGYVGLMAYGNHHQPHHWAMAKGSNPPSHH